MDLAFCLFRYFPFSGLARDMLRIADHAHQRGHRVRIYTAEWHGERNLLHEVEVIPAKGFSNHARAAAFCQSLRRALPSSACDRLVGFNKIPGLDVYYAADACYAARARYARHPLYRLTPRYRGYTKLERSLFEPSTHARILVLSERAISEYQEFYGTQDARFTLLPPNLDPAYRNLGPDAYVRRRVRAELRLAEETKMVLMVGSGFRTKGVDRAVQALGALPEDLRRSTYLVIAGRGKAGPFIQLARQHGVRKQIRFLGGRDDVPRLLRAADLLLHPAYNENTGTVLLESMAAGLPVLTTDVCGYAHHVQAAQAGQVLATPFDQYELNEALRDILSRDLANWSANGVAYARQPTFYRLPESAVDAIERSGHEAPEPPSNPGPFFYLSDAVDLDPRPEGIDAVIALEGEVFREAPARRTLRVRGVGGTGYFLKAHEGVGWREIIKNLLHLRAPVLGAGNEWHALHALGRMGVKAPTPLGFGARGRNPARRTSFVLMNEIENVISLEQLAESTHGHIPDLHLKWALIQALAHISRTLHRNGINHRDFYLCHFLIQATMGNASSGAEPEPCLIDLHRAQLRRKTPRRWIVKDLAGLYFSAMDVHLTRSDLFRFIRTYSGLPLREALHSGPGWHRVQRRARALYRSTRQPDA